MSNQTAWVVGFLLFSIVEFATTHREGAAYFPQLANTDLKSGRSFRNDKNADSEGGRRDRRVRHGERPLKA
jgi:hypothetical protein